MGTQSCKLCSHLRGLQRLECPCPIAVTPIEAVVENSALQSCQIYVSEECIVLPGLSMLDVSVEDINLPF